MEMTGIEMVPIEVLIDASATKTVEALGWFFSRWPFEDGNVKYRSFSGNKVPAGSNHLVIIHEDGWQHNTVRFKERVQALRENNSGALFCLISTAKPEVSMYQTYGAEFMRSFDSVIDVTQEWELPLRGLTALAILLASKVNAQADMEEALTINVGRA